MNKASKKLNTWAKKPFITQLLKQYDAAEVFLVGGAVRDALLDRPTKDFDLVVRGVSKKNLEKFLATRGKVSLVGKRFGVFKFKPKSYSGSDIDIALPRTEHAIALSGAYKDFKVDSDPNLPIDQDLSRRDFTINAMAFNLKTKQLVDPFGGVKDLKAKKIKTVGSAELRFSEDYSRMLRAIRFSSQLGFTIESKTAQAINKKIKNLDRKAEGKFIVPREVLASELNKALIANPIWTLKLLDKFGVLKTLMPELLKMKNCPQPPQWHSEGDVWTHMMLAMSQIGTRKFNKEFKNQNVPAELYWAILFHDLGKPYTIKKTDRIRTHGHDIVSAQKFSEIAERLKLASTGLAIQNIVDVIRYHMFPAAVRRGQIKPTTIEKYFFSNFPGELLLMLIFCDKQATIYDTGKPSLKEFNKLKKMINTLGGKKSKQKKLPAPLVSGRDLIKQFKLKPGPKIGELLELARQQQLASKLKTKKQALIWLKKHL